MISGWRAKLRGDLGMVYAIIAALTVLSPIPAPAHKVPRVPRVGFIHAGSLLSNDKFGEAFRQGLHELGYVEGQTVLIEARWGKGNIERLRRIAAELGENKVDVIVTDTAPAAVAAEEATQKIPIVAVVSDPLSIGLIARAMRPGGRITGLSQKWGDSFNGKWLELLKEIAPTTSDVAVLWNSGWFDRRSLNELQATALAQHLTLHSIEVRDPRELAPAFAVAASQAQALLVLPDPLTLQFRAQIVQLAARSRLPAMYGMREFVDDGGLMAYGLDQAAVFRRAAVYVDGLLKGRSPQVDTIAFQLVLNLKTARDLGRAIPASLLMRADTVGE